MRHASWDHVRGATFATLAVPSILPQVWNRWMRFCDGATTKLFCGPGMRAPGSLTLLTVVVLLWASLPFPSLFLLRASLLYPHMHSLLRALRICTKDVCQPFERRTMECGFGSTNSVHTYCTLCRTRHRNTILFPRISERTPVPVLRIKIENIGF